MTASPATRRAPRPVDARGFSLLELLLVLALLAALGALVLPAALSVRDEASWSADRLSLRATLVDARLTAIDQGIPMLVQFEVGGRLRVRPFIPAESQNAQADPVIDVPARLVVPPEEEFPVLLAVLLPDGQARLHYPIILTDDTGKRTAVRLDALTGHIGLLELKPVEEAT